MAQVEVVLQKERKSQPTGLKFVQDQMAQVYVADVEVESIAYGKLFPGDKVIAVNDNLVLNLVICESMCEGIPKELRMTVERPVKSELPQLINSTPNPTEPQLTSSTPNQTEPEMVSSTANPTEPQLTSSTPNPTEPEMVIFTVIQAEPQLTSSTPNATEPQLISSTPNQTEQQLTSPNPTEPQPISSTAATTEPEMVSSTPNPTETVPNADNTENPDEIQLETTLVNAVLWKEHLWQPSGLSLKTVDGKVIVASITPKSPVDGVLQIGDELVKVDNVAANPKLTEIQIELSPAGRLDLVVRRESAKVSTSAKPSSVVPKSSAAKPQLTESDPELFTFPVVLQKEKKSQPTGLKFVEPQKGQVCVAGVEWDSFAYGKVKKGDRVMAINDYPILSKANCKSMCKSVKGQLKLTVGIPKATSSKEKERVKPVIRV